uniref:Uncharacterized protein n=1 Tax=Anguilla anguilla TaxID=7936 RepID=A0A0E9X4T0_ANGAN
MGTQVLYDYWATVHVFFNNCLFIFSLELFHCTSSECVYSYYVCPVSLCSIQKHFQLHMPSHGHITHPFTNQSVPKSK